MGDVSGQSFTISEQIQDGVYVLDARGELDYAVVAPLEQRLGSAIDLGAQAIVVDLSDATLLTSSVINVLFGTLRRLRLIDGSLVVVCVNPHIRKLLTLTGLDLGASIHTERAAAARAATSGFGAPPDAAA